MNIRVATERITAEEFIERLQQQLEEERKLRKAAEQENVQLNIQVDESVNLLAALKEEIQQLKDEVAILKGQKPRPKIPSSKLEGPGQGNGNSGGKGGKKLTRGKHPRRKKKNKLQIHSKQRIKPNSIPKEAVFKGIQRYTVQDIVFQPHNTVYELERWKLPSGTYLTRELPQNIKGHYGPQLRAHVLYQYYGCRVTEPLLLTQLREVGVLISAGQLHNLLMENKDEYHKEKGNLLQAGIAATGQVQVDDTGARLSGKNGYSTIVGNEYFTFSMTTRSKSRINFFQVLHGGDSQYLINEDAVDYVETLKPGHYLQGYLHLHAFEQSMSQDEWEQFLLKRNITSQSDKKLATEAALFASLLQIGIPRDLGVHGDDAGQFDVFVRSLCWIHEERHYRKIIASNAEIRKEVEGIRDRIWSLYEELKEYKSSPSAAAASAISKKFDDLFLTKTSSPTLNDRLSKTYAKKDSLFVVLRRPETPLHNNLIETDARELVTKRKVSGGTRSETGRICRDTFVSLKKTCCKLTLSFWGYLKDREAGKNETPNLSQVITERASVQPSGP